jgi:hypothetical protein
LDNPYTIKTAFTVREAAAAICEHIPNDDFPGLASTMNELRLAMESGELPHTPAPLYRCPPRYRVGEPIKKILVGTDWSRTTIPRPALLAWCESRGIRPRLLFPEAPLATASLPELHPKEYASILLIVNALLSMFYGSGWRERDRKKLAEEVLHDLQKSGLELPLDERTLLKHLDKAAKQ